MKQLSILAVLAIALLSSCATMRNEAKEVCDLYNEMRDDVVAAREIIKAGFDLYPPKTQAALRRIDAKLPQLDAIGKAACGIADGPPIDWKKARAVIDEVAPYVVLLKKQGVI